MTSRTYDGTVERRVVTALITSTPVLARIASKWRPDLFPSKWSNLIATWCIDYFSRYESAPGKAIEGLFTRWAEGKKKDADTVQIVEKYLESLSGEYERLGSEVNAEHLIDEAGSLLNRTGLYRLADAVQGDLDAGDAAAAEARVVGYSRVELGPGTSVDPFLDQAVMEEAFREAGEGVIDYPGALGKFFGRHLERDGFISFLAPEKRGKTWWLLDVAFRAMLQRRRTALFQVGDMTRNQVMRRLLTRVAIHPVEPCTVRYPTKITRAAGAEFAEVEFRSRKFRTGLDWRQAWRCSREVQAKIVRSKTSYLKLFVFPTRSVNVLGIDAELRNLERVGWVPDVVVIDYADILAPLPGVREPRERINETWMRLRRLSQEHHCLVVTATQSDAAGYDKITLGQANFNNDKRVHGHVTGMVGINQRPQEKENGVFRLNWIDLREGKFVQGHTVHVAGCLELANPAVRSTF